MKKNKDKKEKKQIDKKTRLIRWIILTSIILILVAMIGLLSNSK